MQHLLDYAKSFIGIPYRYGGNSHLLGFDCSGYALEIMRAAGYVKSGQDMSANDLYKFIEPYCSTLDSVPRAGALVFFGESVTKITHVGFALDGYLMLEAGGGDSQTLELKDAIARNAFIRLRPIRYRKDYLTCLNPRYTLIGQM